MTRFLPMTAQRLGEILMDTPEDVEVVICDADEGCYLRIQRVSRDGDFLVVEGDYDGRITQQEGGGE